ncbi:MAG TPA: CbtA family protein [Aestuariivirgaceae bacterium]|nr:CbtA family protein [Aestuariivirgaceae bacterium]
MIRRVVLAAILAGIAAGLVMSAVQHWRVTPLILEAEAYETALLHHGEEEAWAPADGVQRTAFTVIFNVLTGVAFALIAAAASLLTRLPLTSNTGLIWGLAGFATFMLAPSAGLPPELPGMAAGDLTGRQLWWWSAVAATAGGIGLIALTRHFAWKAAAIGLIALPHVIGAPHATGDASAVPAGLANAFAANAIAVSAVFWIVLGVSLGFLLARQTGAQEVS